MEQIITKETYVDDFNKVIEMIEKGKERVYRKVNE